MEERQLDQSQISERIQFGKKYVPPYPYSTDIHGVLNPVIDAFQFETLRQYENRDKDVLHQLKKTIKPLLDDDYEIEYYRVRQKVSKESKSCAIAFHSWYYTKLTDGDTDMTDEEFKGRIYVKAIAINDEVDELNSKSLGGRLANGLLFNKTAEREIHVRRNSYIPRFENTFKLTHLDDDNDPEFFTICYSEDLKRAVVTLHIICLC